MRLRQVKRTIVQLVTFFFLSMLVFLAYLAIATRHGESRAEAFCAAVPVGTRAEVAVQSVRAADTEARLRWEGIGTMGVGFRGALGERWVCHLSVRDGQIAEQEVRLID